MIHRIHSYSLCNVDTLKRGPQLLVYTHLVHIICNSILLHPKAMANVQEYDQLLKDVLQILKCTDSSYVLLDVSLITK